MKILNKKQMQEIRKTRRWFLGSRMLRDPLEVLSGDKKNQRFLGSRMLRDPLEVFV